MKYTIGICAMEAKSRSKPMRNLLQRLLVHEEFETVLFGDKVILDEDIQDWPGCDFLVAFHSTGFPLQKCIDYVHLRRPYCVNDLVTQKLLLDRRWVLGLLDAIGVRTPRRLVITRPSQEGSALELPAPLRKQLQLLRVNVDAIDKVVRESIGATFQQLDDDTIQIGKKTMRKPFVEKPVDSEDHNIWIYYPRSEGGGVRKLFRKVANKSSEFVPDASPLVRTEGSYIYEEFMSVDNAEDVKVYTVGSTYIHAETRKSPVVDGIVKRMAKDGKEMRFVTQLSAEEMDMARKVCHYSGQTVCGLDLLRVQDKSYVIDVNGWSFVKGNDEYYDRCAETLRNLFLAIAKRRHAPFALSREPSVENQWSLKAFLAVFRHGDRTPKQKFKFYVSSEPFVALLNGNIDEVILRKPEELQQVFQIAEQAKRENLEDPEKMDQIMVVLDKKSQYPGTKVQIKPSFSKVDGLLDRMLVIVKWGGEFTHAGQHHSHDLGENLRKDLMLINRTVLQDVASYSSSEWRAVDTTNVFLQAFLEQESIPVDRIQISKEMLDDSNAAKEQMETVKTRLLEILNVKSKEELPPGYPLVEDAILPSDYVQLIYELLRSRREIMRQKFQTMDINQIQEQWCCGESPQLFRERWDRLFREICDVDRCKLDPSKISELYDSLKYDALHNREFVEEVFVDKNENPVDPKSPLRDLFHKAKHLCDFVAPQEYGITDQEKLEIGVLTSVPLLNKIMDCLKEARSQVNPCTRLFFTKESHVHTLFNVIRLSFSPGITEYKELDYLTHITFELYERNRGLGGADMPLEYSLRIGFSPGAYDPGLIDTQMDSAHALAVAPRKWITDHIELEEALKRLTPRLKTPRSSPRSSPKLLLRKTKTTTTAEATVAATETLS